MSNRCMPLIRARKQTDAMENFSEIFITIKPLFDAVIRKPTKAGILKLNEHLKQVDSNSVQILQNIFLQQLIILVDAVPGQNQNELKTHLLECIITILQKGRLTKAVALKTTLLATTKLIYDKKTGKLRPNLSEEYKLAVLKVLSFATRNIQSELVEEIYVKENLTLLSQAIFVCVRIVETERARKLRFQAVDSVLSLLQIHDGFDFNDIVLRCQVAELLFIALPKLLAIYVSIINGDEKQGTAVYRIAIKALGRTLSLIFEDYSKNATNEEYCIERFLQLTESFTEKDRNANVLGLGLRENDKIKYFNETARTREWLLQAEKKVEQVLQLILHLRGHEEELVRLEFAKMNCELLRNCTYNMPSCTVHYLQTVIAMCHDESERVRNVCEKCQESMPYFTISFAGNRIDEMFFDALNRMPRIIYRGEEREQISSFRLITGFLSFFSESQLASVFSCQNILEQFIMVLLAAAELESVDELIRREYVSYRFEYEEGFHLQKEKKESRWIVLKNVSSPRTKQSFLDLIHKLRKHEQAVHTVLMYILEDFYASRLNSNGYLFILSELIPDSSDGNRPPLEPYKTLLSEVLQPHHWFLELDENDNIADQKYNALHVCLVVRTIARLARLMREQFHWYLYDSLRILLQSCGSTLNCINESTELALDVVANSQGLSSIEQLIHHNLDYISQQVTRCLRRKEHFRDGMNILEAVLRFVPYETSNVLETTVTPIIMNILDSYSQYGEKNSIVCLRVLQIFIHSIKLRYEHVGISNPTDNSNEKVATNLTEQIERLQTLLQREIANEPEDIEFKPDEASAAMDQTDEQQETEHENEPEAEENKDDEAPLPAHVKIVLRILTVNFKHLASSDDAERIVALCTLNEGIYVLQRYENQLLPLVHNIWFNFTERFSDRNPAVVSNAFDLLVTLARLAKDFIRNRSLDDVLPKLYKFMKDHWNADASAHQVYKLQCKFLTSIDELVRNLNFSEKQLDQVLEVIRLYWEKCERRELKKRAAECMQRMRAINSLAVFLKCGCKVVLQ
ncbi:TELO2-interacting protein 1 homolog [Anopheles stephensi]|uniref:TELO2-interacting protein 1 homolog n=1 Tax=Anopheles stephensi TaxID=30069 RepID=UPI001658B538|nr:TELO2-interacting protein 1 homolog [Anopheles stephensi]